MLKPDSGSPRGADENNAEATPPPDWVPASIVAAYVCGALELGVLGLESMAARGAKVVPHIANLFGTNNHGVEMLLRYTLLAAMAVSTLACAWCLAKGRKIDRLIVAPPTIVLLWWMLRAFGVILS